MKLTLTCILNMDCEQDTSFSRVPEDKESRSAVNSLILDYYKKFGRKRDLEQYFSLSTAQSDIRDPSSTFWARMKAENESSDSGERSDKKSDSSQELCRISIRFPAQDPFILQDDDLKTKTESTSPPIIIEELPRDSKHNSEDETTKSEDDAMKSDDNSQKSYDVHLDSSLNKLHSPSSSITSQRRLEWDSLADVGYANESDRKTSASSLSTLERLALKQQYSNDTQQNSNLGIPTAHSTPLDENDVKLKSKKGVGKKTTKIYKKDIDVVEVNVPHLSNLNPTQSINVNLTKHISFNVEKDGKVTVDNVLKDISVSPEKVSIETEAPAICQRTDREMQTSLTKASHVSCNIPDKDQQKIPVLISLNTLRSRVRRRRIRMAKRKLKSKKRVDKENIPLQEKSGEQLSEAESFEYMPGHIYNQNQITANNGPSNSVPLNAAGNKSSLESSRILTSDSSKGSKHSFTKDLEKSIELLKTALNQRCDDTALRKKLIQQVCQRLLNSRYRDDESTTDFLSGLSFSSKKLGLGERNSTTTSTSDANNSVEKSKRPKKSILRTDKFNPAPIASTSQSVPNLPVASKSENFVTSNLVKNLTPSNTESDMSSKEKSSSDNGFKVSSEELYKKYLQALKREEAYKKQLKEKEMFLKHKLVCSDSAVKILPKVELKQNNRLKDLINDLTRNNYDDGSGDASKLEGGLSPDRDFDRFLPNRVQRSHSVFTLSSGISDGQNKKSNMRKKLQCEVKDLSKPGPSKDTHYCCCPHHGNLKFTDSSVQVNMENMCSHETCPAKHLNQENIETPKRSAKVISDDVTGNLKYVCLCSKNEIQDAPDDFLIYKCSRLNNKGIQLEESVSKSSNEVYVQCNNVTCTNQKSKKNPYSEQHLNSKSSQTNMLIKMLEEQPTHNLVYRTDYKQIHLQGSVDDVIPYKSTVTINESTRWIQTEISINPKITEPTLSDINIVSDTNCAKLVSEHCRELTKSSATEIPSNQAVASSTVFSDSNTGTSKDIGKNINEEEIDQKRSENIIDKESKIEHSGNFTIPIHGTNMTLMVRIGSDPLAFHNRNATEMVTQCIGTDKVNAIEQATSLREECSKGVQSDKNSGDTFIIEHASNNIDEMYTNESKKADFVRKPCMVNVCQTTEDNKFGTYPQKSPGNVRTPFRRSNTDTDKIQCVLRSENCSCGCGGTEETCKKTCKQLLTTKQSDTQKISNQHNSSEYGDKCQCGCDGPKNACTYRCKKRVLESNIQLDPDTESCISQPKFDIQTITQLVQEGHCGKQPVEEEVCTQTDWSLSEDKKCSCGCGGTNNRCKKSCKEYQPLPKNVELENRKKYKKQIDTQTDTEVRKNGQCVKQLIDKEVYMLTDISLNDKCSCGCGNVKDKCKRKCKEYELTSRNKVMDNNRNLCIPSDKETGFKKDKLTKEVNIQTKDALYENCTCGCNREKNKCSKSCRDNIANCEIQSNKKIDKEPYLSTNTDENCQNDDIKIKLASGKPEVIKEDWSLYAMSYSPTLENEKCPCGCGAMKNTCLKTCKEVGSIKKIDRTQTDKKEIATQNNHGKPSQTFEYSQEEENKPSSSYNIQTTVPRQGKTQTDKREVATQKNRDESPQSLGYRGEEKPISNTSRDVNIQSTEYNDQYLEKTESGDEKSVVTSSNKSQKSSSETEPTDSGSDPIINLIQNITKKYTKNDVEKSKRKKCFKEIMTVLNYLLDTDESPVVREGLKDRCESTTTVDDTDTCPKKVSGKSSCEKVSKKLVDKAVQPSPNRSKSNPCGTDSSEVLTSTDVPGTSTDSATCKVLKKIKKECDKYHQKRCKVHSCEGTSSTSMNCDQCRRIHHCQCRSHKCKNHKKSTEKMQKTSVAYNLILQTSESVMSEGPSSCEKTRTLKNIIVKVPKKKPHACIPFRELAAKFEKQMSSGTPKDARCCRSKSLPNDSEISSMEEIMRRSQGATVREYLEKNRPDFIEKCAQRQTCMRYNSEFRANERAVKRELLSLHLAQLPDVTEFDSAELNELAAEFGRYLRNKQPAPKLISEREMKKHSEKIYKSLPEVVQKKEEKRKENIKKTNLLMANIFKRNLQKKTLRGTVNLSNYSTVIKI